MNQQQNESFIPDEVVMSKIYVIRGQKVMIDSDLADLYEVETKVLNQAVNRNIERFPSDFMFELSLDEWENLKSQFVTSSWGGRRKLPKVFTEHGVLMLSSVLNSHRAIQVNIQIVRIFTRIRQVLTSNTEIRKEIKEIKKQLFNHEQHIELVFNYLDELTEKKENPVPRKRIGYKSDDI